MYSSLIPINITSNDPAYATSINKMLGFKVIRYVLLAAEQRATRMGAKFHVTYADLHTFPKVFPRHRYLPETEMHALNLHINGKRIVRLCADFDFKYVFLTLDTDANGDRMPDKRELFAWKLLFPFCHSNVRVVYTHLPINSVDSFSIHGNPSDFKINAEGYGEPGGFMTPQDAERREQRRENEYDPVTEELPGYMQDIIQRIKAVLKEQGERDV